MHLFEFSLCVCYVCLERCQLRTSDAPLSVMFNGETCVSPSNYTVTHCAGTCGPSMDMPIAYMQGDVLFAESNCQCCTGRVAFLKLSINPTI